jgi:malonate transporter and related proteins
MTKLLLDTLVPIFAGLLLGYFAGRRGLMDNVNVKTLIVLVMNFAVPCALFSTLIQSSREVLQQHIAASLVITFTYGALYMISYFWARRFLRMHVSESSVLALTIGFPNAAAVALPLLTGAYGPNASVTAALSIAIGSITISPLTLALLEADKQSAGAGISMRTMLRSFPRAVARPVVWAPVIALIGAYFGLHLPSFVTGTLTTLGSAAAGSALILTGVVVSAQRFHLSPGVLFTTAAKLLVQPLLALGIMIFFRMSPGDIRDITLISAIPGGFFGVVFGKGFDQTSETASSGLIATYVLGCITLTLWMLMLGKFF